MTDTPALIAVKTWNALTSIAGLILTSAAQGAAYEVWSDTFARKEVQNAWRNIDPISGDPRLTPRLTLAELNILSLAQLRSLGFKKWDGDLVLLPLWVWCYIADGEELHSIGGERIIKGEKNVDLDVRFGCVAYGWFHTPPAIETPSAPETDPDAYLEGQESSSEPT